MKRYEGTNADQQHVTSNTDMQQQSPPVHSEQSPSMAPRRSNDVGTFSSKHSMHAGKGEDEVIMGASAGVDGDVALMEDVPRDKRVHAQPLMLERAKFNISKRVVRTFWLLSQHSVGTCSVCMVSGTVARCHRRSSASQSTMTHTWLQLYTDWKRSSCMSGVHAIQRCFRMGPGQLCRSIPFAKT